MAFEAAARRGAAGPRTTGAATSDSLSLLSSRMWTAVQELATLDKLTDSVDTPADTTVLRQRLAISEQKLLALRSELDDAMRRVRVDVAAQSNPSTQRSAEKLMQQYTEIQTRMEASLTRSRQLQRACIPREALPEERNPRAGRGTEALAQVQIELRELGDVDAAIDAERRREAAIILSETKEVDGMMTRVAVEVKQQGEQLNQVEANVGASKEAVKQGNNELVQAQEYQRAVRRKYCLVIVLIVIVLAIIIVPIVITKVPFK